MSKKFCGKFAVKSNVVFCPAGFCCRPVAMPDTGKDEYNTGNKKIDNHHKQIIKFINKFIENPELSIHSQEFIDILDGMMKYTFEHFSYEEQCLLNRNI